MLVIMPYASDRKATYTFEQYTVGVQNLHPFNWWCFGSNVNESKLYSGGVSYLRCTVHILMQLHHVSELKKPTESCAIRHQFYCLSPTSAYDIWKHLQESEIRRATPPFGSSVTIDWHTSHV